MLAIVPSDVFQAVQAASGEGVAGSAGDMAASILGSMAVDNASKALGSMDTACASAALAGMGSTQAGAVMERVIRAAPKKAAAMLKNVDSTHAGDMLNGMSAKTSGGEFNRSSSLLLQLSFCFLRRPIMSRKIILGAKRACRDMRVGRSRCHAALMSASSLRQPASNRNKDVVRARVW
jgi:hypothetical protein